MVKAFRVLIAGVASVSAFAVMAAAPAQADEATYLQRLLTKYTYLNPQQLLAEGDRVCDAERRSRLTGGVNRFGRRFPRRSGKSEEGAYVRVEEGIACRAAARTDR